MIRTNTILSSGAALIATLIAAPALALTYDYSIDFEDMTHGQVLGSHDYSQVELLYVHNKQQEFDRIGVAFDTNRLDTPQDHLEAPFTTGNLAGADLGHALIIQENDNGCGDGWCDDPADSDHWNPGHISIRFDDPIKAFRLDVIDVNDSEEFGGLAFFSNGERVGSTAWADVEGETVDGAGEVVFGENSANRLPFIEAAQFGAESFDWVIVVLGGTGAVDNLEWRTTYAAPVPEPSSGLLFGAGLAIAGMARRKRA